MKRALADIDNRQLITTSDAADLAALNSLAAVHSWYVHLAELVDSGEMARDTADTYTRGMRRFTNWYDDTGRHDTISDSVVRQWIASMRQDNQSVATINVHLAGVKNFYKFAVAKGLQHNPTTGVSGPKRKGTTKSHKRQTLTDAEMRRVLAWHDDTTAHGARDAAMIALMAYTSIRTVTLRRSNYKDLRSDGGRLVMDVQRKGHTEKDDLVIIPAPAADALATWLAFRGDAAGPLFQSVGIRNRGGRISPQLVRAAVRAAFVGAGVAMGNRTKTAHSLRHTAIMKALRAGAELTEVMAMSGHSNPNSIAPYIHTLNRLDNPAEERIEY